MRVVVFGTYDTDGAPARGGSGRGTGRAGLRRGRRSTNRCGSVPPTGSPCCSSRGDLPLAARRDCRRAGPGCWSRSARRPRPDAVLVPYLGHFDVLLARAAGRGAPSSWTTWSRQPARPATAACPVASSCGCCDLLDSTRHRRGGRRRGRHRGERERLPARRATGPWSYRSGPRARGSRRGHAGTEQHRGRCGWCSSGPSPRCKAQRRIARALARVPRDTLAVTLLGTGQDHDEVRRTPGGARDITWHDWVPIEELPAPVADHDVCLGIFGTTAKALTVVPTKIYQGAQPAAHWSPATPPRTGGPGRRGRARAARRRRCPRRGAHRAWPRPRPRSAGCGKAAAARAGALHAAAGRRAPSCQTVALRRTPTARCDRG